MTWVAYGPFTGVGEFDLTDTSWSGLVRVHLTSLGNASQYGPLGTPQRLGNTGWIAIHDHDTDTGSPDVSGDWIGSPHWLQYEFSEFDFTEFVATIFGASGIAYGLFPGATIELFFFYP